VLIYLNTTLNDNYTTTHINGDMTSMLGSKKKLFNIVLVEFLIIYFIPQNIWEDYIGFAWGYLVRGQYAFDHILLFALPIISLLFFFKFIFSWRGSKFLGVKPISYNRLNSEVAYLLNFILILLIIVNTLKTGLITPVPFLLFMAFLISESLAIRKLFSEHSINKVLLRLIAIGSIVDIVKILRGAISRNKDNKTKLIDDINTSDVISLNYLKDSLQIDRVGFLKYLTHWVKNNNLQIIGDSLILNKTNKQEFTNSIESQFEIFNNIKNSKRKQFFSLTIIQMIFLFTFPLDIYFNWVIFFSKICLPGVSCPHHIIIFVGTTSHLVLLLYLILSLIYILKIVYSWEATYSIRMLQRFNKLYFLFSSLLTFILIVIIVVGIIITSVPIVIPLIVLVFSLIGELILIKNLFYTNNYKEDIIQISNLTDRISLELLRTMLNLDAKRFFDNIYLWINELGFKIDGNDLIIKKENITSFIELLDKNYKEWETLEKNKIKKK